MKSEYQKFEDTMQECRTKQTEDTLPSKVVKKLLKRLKESEYIIIPDFYEDLEKRISRLERIVVTLAEAHENHKGHEWCPKVLKLVKEL